MSKKANIIYIVMFLAFIGAFFLLGIVLPQRSFSEQENRALQTRPDFRAAEFFSGSFGSSYEDYVTDQFPLRDSWITLKARAELASGKDANKSVYLCENDTLIEAFTAPETEKLNSNIEAINALCDNAGVSVYTALIPTAAQIWADKLPAGAPNDSEKELIDYVYSGVKSYTVDVYSALASHAGEDIFYRTDHHWTTLGAYYGYTSVMEAMGLTPRPLSDFSEETVTQAFYGTACASSGFSWVEPDEINVYARQGGAVITNYPDGAAVEGSLYDESYLERRDKYSYFYGGNTPLLQIETGISDGENLLILRDSYMDSLSPFMLEDFAQLHIIDLRYYKLSISKYIQEHDIDRVLVAYSVPNFAEDKYIFLMAY